VFWKFKLWFATAVTDNKTCSRLLKLALSVDQLEVGEDLLMNLTPMMMKVTVTRIISVQLPCQQWMLKRLVNVTC